MKVYCVFDNDYEGCFLQSIWATEEAAESEAKRLNEGSRRPWYGVEEWEVQGEVDAG